MEKYLSVQIMNFETLLLRGMWQSQDKMISEFIAEVE